MREELKRAYESVRPYLVYPRELEERLERLGGDVQRAVKRLQEEAEKLDAVRRTDVRIFLNELRKLLQQARPA